MVFHGGNANQSEKGMRGKRNPTSGSSEVLLPPCRVCGAPGSGFHYGVTTCEACKGFFRRSFVRDCPYQCIKSRHCVIGPSTSRRQSCPKCRYNKCLAVGMSRGAIKTGRYSLDKKCQDILELVEHKKSNGLLVDSLEEKAQAAVEKSNRYKGRKRKGFGDKDHAESKKTRENRHSGYSSQACPQWPQSSYIGEFGPNGDDQLNRPSCQEVEMGNEENLEAVSNASLKDQPACDTFAALLNLKLTPEPHQLNPSTGTFYSTNTYGNHAYIEHAECNSQLLECSQGQYNSPDPRHGHIEHNDERLGYFSQGTPPVYSSPNQFVSDFTANSCGDNFISPHEPEFLPFGIPQRSNAVDIFPGTKEKVTPSTQTPAIPRHDYSNQYMSDIQCNAVIHCRSNSCYCKQSSHNPFQVDNFLQSPQDCNISNYAPRSYDDDSDIYRHTQHSIDIAPADLNTEGVIARSFLGKRWEEISTPVDDGSCARVESHGNDLDKFSDMNSHKVVPTSYSLPTRQFFAPSPFPQFNPNGNRNQDISNVIHENSPEICHKSLTILENELEGLTSVEKIERIKERMDSLSDSSDSSDVLVLACKLPELSRYRFSSYQTYPFISYASEMVSPFLKNVIDISHFLGKNTTKPKGTAVMCSCAVCVKPTEAVCSFEKAVMTTDRVCEGPWERSELVESLCNTEFGRQVDKYLEAHYKLIGRHQTPMTQREIDVAIDIYFDLAKLKKRMYGSNRFIPWETYAHLLETKGIHADDRRHMLSLYAERFNETLPNFIRCCRFIPGFASLGTKDKMQLARDGVFSWQMLNSFDGIDAGLRLWLDRQNKWVVEFDEWDGAFPGFFDAFKRFSVIMAELKGLQLSSEEVIIMKAIAVMSPSRSSLQQQDLVEEMSAKLKTYLRELIEKRHYRPEDTYDKVINLLDRMNQGCSQLFSDHDQCKKIYGLVLKEKDLSLYKEIMLLT